MSVQEQPFAGIRIILPAILFELGGASHDHPVAEKSLAIAGLVTALLTIEGPCSDRRPDRLQNRRARGRRYVSYSMRPTAAVLALNPIVLRRIVRHYVLATRRRADPGLRAAGDWRMRTSSKSGGLAGLFLLPL